MTSEIDWKEREREIDRELALIEPCEKKAVRVKEDIAFLAKLRAVELVHIHGVDFHGVTPAKPDEPILKAIPETEDRLQYNLSELTACILREAKKQK